LHPKRIPDFIPRLKKRSNTKAFEPLENPNGMLAVTSAGGTEFIQDGSFFPYYFFRKAVLVLEKYRGAVKMIVHS
jgi:hypothetical protein